MDGFQKKKCRNFVSKEAEKAGRVEVHVVPTGTGISVLGSF